MNRFFLTSLLLAAGLASAQTSVPEIPYDSAPNLLKLPEHIYLGEARRCRDQLQGKHFRLYADRLEAVL